MTAANWRVAYLAIRTVAWYLLWFFVWADGLVHRKSRGRGWKLHWGLRGVLTAYVVAEALRLDVGRRLDSVPPFEKNGLLRNDSAFKAYVFFIDTADTLFMLLLILIASGYCITRNSLGPNKKRIIFLPMVYGATALITDFVRLQTCPEMVARMPIEHSIGDCIDADSKTFVPAGVWVIVFIFSWVYVIDNLSQEMKMLQKTSEGPVQNIDGEPPTANRDTSPSSAAEGAEGGSADGKNPPEHQDLQGGDHAPTLEDVLTTDVKLKLLGRFYTLVLLYVFTAIFVNLLPLGIQTKHLHTWTEVFDMLYNAILFVFLALMSWIFRPLDDNPYLLLDDELGLDGADLVTTELGMIVMDENQPRITTASSRPGASSKPEEVDHNFALDDDEDLSEYSRGGESPRIKRKRSGKSA